MLKNKTKAKNKTEKKKKIQLKTYAFQSSY